ncbi:MAG: prepilin-type N-terminal cleavage/methylation domain-containing protein, partial [Betaproteobacteria bacterium]|nr:prepilin-type N-terminal cleavage/methylation domain-containing protein [Betaproteobacteria bacterium]
MTTTTLSFRAAPPREGFTLLELLIVV